MSGNAATSGVTPLVRRLADWIDAFDAGAIPDAALDRAKMLVLDSIGCALGAMDEETPRSALATVRALGGAPECTVIGTDLKTSAALATLANGILVRALDLNDLGLGATGASHPSDNIPVALALGEHENRSAREVLSAIVMGYEVYGRVHDLMRIDCAWDNVSASGPVAAAMAGRLLGLAPDKLSHALALAMSHCHTLGIVRFGQLSAAKAMANSMVAHSSVMATLLAAHGASGPQTVFEGPSGMLQASLDRGDPSGLIASLNVDDLRIMRVNLKSYPCLGSGQAAVAAAIEARKRIGDPSAQIERIAIRMADTPFVRAQVNDPQRDNPNSRETADHSFLYLVAVALLDGELTPAQFGEGRWFDPAVRALMSRTTVRNDPALNEYTPAAFPCGMDVLLRDGSSIAIDMPYPPGNIRNPLGWPGVEAKFHRYASDRLSQARRELVVNAVKQMDSGIPMRELMRLVAK